MNRGMEQLAYPKRLKGLGLQFEKEKADGQYDRGL